MKLWEREKFSSVQFPSEGETGEGGGEGGGGGSEKLINFFSGPIENPSKKCHCTSYRDSLSMHEYDWKVHRVRLPLRCTAYAYVLLIRYR